MITYNEMYFNNCFYLRLKPLTLNCTFYLHIHRTIDNVIDRIRTIGKERLWDIVQEILKTNL